MKTRKLMAILVMVAMIVTALPMVAFAADEEPNRFQSDFEVNRTTQRTGRDITLTIYTLDADGKPVPAAVYIATNRGEDTDKLKLDGDEVDAEDDIWCVKTDDDNGEVEVKLTSNVPGKLEIGVALNADNGALDPDDVVTLYDYMTGESANANALGLIGTQVVEFEAASADGLAVSKVLANGKKEVVENDDGEYDAADAEDADIEEIVRGNGLDYYEVSFRVTSDDTPVRGEEVKFSANKTDVRFNKTSVDTNVAGIATVKVYADSPGTYKVKAVAAGKSKEVKLVFSAGIVAGIALESGGNGEVTAAEEKYSFKLKLMDINGNKFKINDGIVKAYEEDDEVLGGLEFEVVTEPEDSDLDEDFALAADDGFLKVTVGEGELEEEGNYTIRAKLDNGRYVDVKFEVKEQGDIVELQLSYKQKALALGQKSSTPTVKLVDADGVKRNADLSDVTFVVSDSRMIQNNINEEVKDLHGKGQIIATDDDKRAGTLTITAIDRSENVTGTYTMEIGVEAMSFDVVVPELVVDEDNDLEVQFYDANGNAVALGDDASNVVFDYVVIKKPAGAIVSVDEASNFEKNLRETGKSTVTVSSNETGVVEVQFIIEADLKDEDGEDVTKYFTNRVSLPFGVAAEDEVEGAEKVVLTIGSNIAVVDGVAQEFDAPAFIEGGRTYVPFRFIAEAFGAEVDWTPKDGPTETVFLTRGDMEVSIGIGDSFLTVTTDGEAEVQAFDGAAQIKEGRTFLPFRAIAEAFGAEVDYGPADGPVEWVSFQQ
ncbi:MAG: stalk domain-containing protein [bacterium]